MKKAFYEDAFHVWLYERSDRFNRVECNAVELARELEIANCTITSSIKAMEAEGRIKIISRAWGKQPWRLKVTPPAEWTPSTPVKDQPQKSPEGPRARKKILWG